MTWYKTGTVTVTNGSANITLAGGDALQNIFPDDGFVGPDGRTYAVLTVGGAGSFTLSTNYAGPTAAGANYLIIPSASFTQLRDVLTQINTLIATYQGITLNAGVGKFEPGSAASPGVRANGHEGSGLVWNSDGSVSISVNGTIVATFAAGGGITNVTFPDGTVGVPGIRFTNDTDTGIHRSGNNTIDIVTGGASRMRIANDKVVIGLSSGVSLDVLGTVKAGASNTTTGVVGVGLLYNNGYGGAFGALRSSGDITLSKYCHPSPTVGNEFVSSIDAAATRTAIVMSNTQISFQFGASTTTPIGNPVTLNTAVTFTSAGSLTASELHIDSNHYIGASSSNNRDYWFDAGDVLRYSRDINQLNLITGGITRFLINPDVASFSGQMLVFQGTASAPGYSFSGDTDTGMYRSNADTLSFVTAGTLRAYFTSAGHFLPASDNAYQTGSGSLRWSVVYAATGTINTSDEREKTWRGAPTKAELLAASAIIAELGFFQWNDAIAIKGDDARYHFGVRAQRVWSIMAEHGLVDPIGKNGKPGKTGYAFLCYDEWDEEREPIIETVEHAAVYEGRGKNRKLVTEAYSEQVETGATRVIREAGNRYGVRIDQLTMFLIAAQEARIAAIEERLNND